MRARERARERERAIHSLLGLIFPDVNTCMHTWIWTICVCPYTYMCMEDERWGRPSETVPLGIPTTYRQPTTGASALRERRNVLGGERDVI